MPDETEPKVEAAEEPTAGPGVVIEVNPDKGPVKGRRGGALAFGALATGALAIGALAIGTLAIGRLAVGRARIRTLHIDKLIVRRVEGLD